MRAADINVVNHQFCVTEFGNDMGELPDDAPNGLIAANGTGCLILTGLHTGRVNVTVEPLQAAPPALAEPWDEIVEVTVVSRSGALQAWGLYDGPTQGLPDLTPAGPGTYRLRAHARGRDQGHAADHLLPEEEPCEYHLLQCWPARTAPDTILRQTDNFGTEWRTS
jgi:hypothetical protein